MVKCSWHCCNKEFEPTKLQRTLIDQGKKPWCSKGCKLKEAVTRRRRRLKELAVETHGGKCVRCGWNEHIAGLTFHHKNPKTKEFALGGGGQTRSWDRVKEEISKCTLLCHNCHNVIHATNDPNYIVR